jgi:hypothetical protein
MVMTLTIFLFQNIHARLSKWAGQINSAYLRLHRLSRARHPLARPRNAVNENDFNIPLVVPYVIP